MWTLIAFLLFLAVFIYSVRSYRQIKNMQYFEDTNHALILMGEHHYETCIRNVHEPNVFVLRRKHKNFRQAKRRHRKLVKECRYMNHMLLKKQPSRKKK